MFPAFAALVVSMLASPVFSDRELASRLPWYVLVITVPSSHPDAEVRMRRNHDQPHWYKVLKSDPWVLKAIAVTHPMYEGLWLKDPARRARLYKVCRALDVYQVCQVESFFGFRDAEPMEVTEEWCRSALAYIRSAR